MLCKTIRIKANGNSDDSFVEVCPKRKEYTKTCLLLVSPVRAAEVNRRVSCDLHMTANTNYTIRRKWKKKKKKRIKMNTYSDNLRYQD